MKPTDENALVERARAGDTSAFEALVRLYDRRVLRLAVRIVRSEETARDVYQETFLKVWRSLEEFDHKCAFGTWVFRIASNVCLDHVRRARRMPEGPATADDRIGGARGLEALVADDRPGGDPERALARREIGARVERALADLPPRERLVFELRHYEGLRLAAVAEALETTEETIRNCLYRAHRRLRTALADLAGVPRAAALGAGRVADGTRRGMPGDFE